MITENVKNNEFTVWSHAFEGVDLDADETSNSYKLAEKAMTEERTEQGCILHVAQKTFFIRRTAVFMNIWMKSDMSMSFQRERATITGISGTVR